MMTPLRINVLILVGAGYAALLIIFIAMVWPGGMTANDAYEVVKGPLMALIGGSLAISKDLIPLDDRGSEGRNNGSNGQQQQRQNKPATEEDE